MTLPTKMKGVQLIGHGDLDMLHYKEDITVPTPLAHQVLIKVAAAGVNNTDLNTRIGWYSKGDNNSDDAGWAGNALKLPLIQGADVCGYIVAVGDKVDSARIGERVLIEPSFHNWNGETQTSPWYFGSECNGGFAQYTVIDAQYAHVLNSSMSDQELASFPCSYSTAENMLTRSQVNAQDTVLITGASGGVGSAAVQLAKLRGAKVIAVTSPSKQQALLDLGADQVVARGDDLVASLGENSVSLVVDLVAGSQWPQFLQILKPGSRYVVSGAIDGPLVELDVRTLYLKDLSFFGCTTLQAGVFSNLVRYINDNKIRPLLAQTFPLRDIKAAQQAFTSKQHIGKIVLEVPQD